MICILIKVNKSYPWCLLFLNLYLWFYIANIGFENSNYIVGCNFYFKNYWPWSAQAVWVICWYYLIKSFLKNSRAFAYPIIISDWFKLYSISIAGHFYISFIFFRSLYLYWIFFKSNGLFSSSKYIWWYFRIAISLCVATELYFPNILKSYGIFWYR